MKYHIKKIFTGATAGTIAITSSISGIPAIYASEFTETSVYVDEESQENISAINPAVDVPDRDFDKFEPATPEVPVIEQPDRDFDKFETITPEVPVIEQPDRDFDKFKPITPEVTVDSSTLNIKSNIEFEDYFDYEKEYYKGVYITTITGFKPEKKTEAYELIELNDGVFIIPEMFEGEPVRKIGDDAFKGETFEKVIIPSNVEIIGYRAFEKTAIESIEIPANVKIIHNMAFRYCSGLTEVTFNEGLEEIGGWAFLGCSLTSVELPDTVKLVREEAFKNNNISTLRLGPDVYRIGDGAFLNNVIESLELPEGLRSIDSHAFANNKITKLNIPTTVEDIQEFAFIKNEIEELTFAGRDESDSDLRLYPYVFYDNNIKNVHIPEFVDLKYAHLAFAQNPIEFIDVKSDIEILPANIFVQTATKEAIRNEYFVINELVEEHEPQVNAGTVEESILKEAFLPDTITNSVFEPLPIPKYAIISNSAKYTMNSQVYEGAGVPRESIINKADWSSKRDHSEEAKFEEGEYIAYDGYGETYFSDYYIVGSVFRKYSVDLVELPDGVTFEDGSTTLQGKSLMNIEEIEAFLNENPPVKKGYEFASWDYRNSNLETTATEMLLLDGDEPARYLVNDVEGIRPMFTPLQSTPNIHLEAEKATQIDALNTNFDAKIKVYGEVVGSLQPNQEFWYSLTDGYEFDVNSKISIKFDNATNKFVFVDSFTEDCDSWQLMLSDDKTKIYTKAPVYIDKIDEDKPVTAYIENLAIKKDDHFFGDRSRKVIEVFLNIEDIGVITSAVIAELDFIPALGVIIKQATPKDALSTLNDGTISLVSELRYSFRRNTTYVLKLDDEFIYTHDYGDVSQHVGEFEFSNTQIDVVDYVPSIKGLEGGSPNWRFAVSDDFNSIHVKTPFDLFPEEDPDGVNGTASNVEIKEGISFDIHNIGITDVTGIEDNYVNGNLRSVNITVSAIYDNDSEIEIGQSVIANLVNDAVDSGNGGGSGGGNGGGGNTKPKEEAVVVAEEILIDPYLNGYPDGTFKPKGFITRAEVANILYKIYGGNNAYNKSVLSEYSDLVNYAWYSDAVSFAIEEDIFVGYPDGSFKPNEPITREEISTVLARMLAKYEVSENIEETEQTVFSDIDNSWAKEDIELLARKGILLGYPDGEFKLKNNTMRSEFASLMNKLTARPEEYKTDNTYTDLNSSAWYYEDIMNASNYAIKQITK